MRQRDGFTILELIIAMGLLAAVFLAVTGATATYAHGVTSSGARASALQMVDDRIQEVRMHPRYGELLIAFDGTEFDVNGMSNAVRTTKVTRTVKTVGSGEVDYTTVTVEVIRPGLVNPVSRSTIVGAP